MQSENAGPAANEGSSRKFWPWLVGAVAVGAILRSHQFLQIGLSHFDEGIYAFSGAVVPWSIAAVEQHGYYSPPLFPAFVHAVYTVMGTAVDWGPASISLLASLATIPLGFCVGRRIGGPIAGILAAWLLAVDGMQIAFARIGLTDALFTFFLLFALLCIERALVETRAGSRIWQTVFAGLLVGCAWNTKYHGFLPLVLALGWVPGPGWRQRLTLLVWISAIAAACYLPWATLFHVKHGYDTLLGHQRGYYQGPAAIPANWQRGREAAAVLHNDAGCALLLLWGAVELVLRRSFAGIAIAALATGLLTVPALVVPLLAVGALLPCRGSHSIQCRVLPIRGYAWTLAWLSVLPAMYTPYLRLWLPTATLLTILVATGIVNLLTWVPPGRLTWLWGILVLVTLGMVATTRIRGLEILPRSPDGYRRAAMQLADWSRRERVELLTLARPPLLFYLAKEAVPFRRLAGDRFDPNFIGPAGVLVVDHALTDSPAFAQSLEAYEQEGLELLLRIPVEPSRITQLDDYFALPRSLEPYDLRVYRRRPGPEHRKVPD